jgi:hypothetical protein
MKSRHGSGPIIALRLCMVEIPSQNQIWQNPPKPSQETAKKIKEKGLDFLGFSLLDWAFSMVAATPQAKKIFPCSFFAVSLRGRRQTLAANDQGSMISDFRKGNSTRIHEGSVFRKARARASGPVSNRPRRGRSFPCNEDGLRKPTRRPPGRRMSSQPRRSRCGRKDPRIGRSVPGRREGLRKTYP